MAQHEVKVNVTVDKSSVLKEWNSMIEKMNKDEIKINTKGAKESIDELTSAVNKLGKTKITSMERITKQLETFSASIKSLNSIKVTQFDSLNAKFEKLGTSLQTLQGFNLDNMKSINSTMSRLSTSLESLGKASNVEVGNLSKGFKNATKTASLFTDEVTKSFKNMGTSMGVVEKHLANISTFGKKDFNKLAQMSEVMGTSLKKMFSGGPGMEQFIANIKEVTRYIEGISRLDTNIAKRIFGENLGTQAETVGSSLQRVNKLLNERTSILKQMSTTTNAQSYEALNAQLRKVDSELNSLGQSYKAAGNAGEYMVQKMASNFQSAQNKMESLQQKLNAGFKMAGGSQASQKEIQGIQKDLDLLRGKYDTLVRDFSTNPIKVMSAFDSGALFKEISMLENRIKSVKVDTSNETKFDSLTAKVQKLNSAFTNTKQMITGLKLNVDTTKLETAKKLMNDLSQMKITPKSSSEEITNYTKKYQEAKTVVDQLTASVDKLAKSRKIDLNIDTLITRLGKLKGQSSSADMEIDKLVESLQRLKSEGNINVKMKGFDEINRQSQQLRSSLSNMQTSIKHTGKMWNNLANVLSTVTPIYMLSRVVTKAFSGSIQKIIDVDSALRDLRKIAPPSFDTSTESLENLRQKAIEVGQSVAATSTDVIKSTTSALMLGIEDMDKAMEYARNSVMYANVSNQSQDAADKQLKAILSAYGGVNKALEKNGKLVKGAGNDYNLMTAYMDAANYAGNNFALTSGDVGEAMMRVASVFKSSNVEMADGISLIVGAQESVQNASKVGMGLKTITTNLNGIKTSAKDGSTSLNKSAVALQKLGVAIKDENGEMKNATEILDELGKKWKDLGKDDKSGIAEAIAGKNHINTLLALMNNWETVLQYQKEYQQGMMVGSAERENKRYIDSIEGKLTLIKENLNQLVTTFMKTDMFKNILDGVNKFLTAMTKVFKMLDKTPGLLQSSVLGVGIAGMKSIKQLGAQDSTGVTSYYTRIKGWYKEASKGANDLTKSNNDLVASNDKVTSSTNKVTTATNNMRRTISETSQSSNKLTSQIIATNNASKTTKSAFNGQSQILNRYGKTASTVGNQVGEASPKLSVFTQEMAKNGKTGQEVAKNSSKLTSTFKGMGNAAKSVGSSLLGMGKNALLSIGNMAMITAAIYGIQLLYTEIYKAVNANKILHDQQVEKSEQSASVVAGYRNEISSLTNLQERYDELNKKTKKTKDEEAELLELRQQIATISPDLVIGWDDENQPLLALNGTLEEHIGLLKERMKLEQRSQKAHENSAGRSGLREVQKMNDKLRDQYGEGGYSYFRFVGEASNRIISRNMFGQLADLETYSKNYRDILERRNEEVEAKNEELAEIYEKNQDYIISVRQLALNQLNDNSRYKNWQGMDEDVTGSMYSLFGSFNWAGRFSDTTTEQNKFLDGFDKIAKSAKSNKKELKEWTTTIETAQKAYQSTGDADSFAKAIGGIAIEFEKLTGIKADQWIEQLRGQLEGAMSEEDMRLNDYLKTQGTSFFDYLNGEEYAIKIKAEWDENTRLAEDLNSTLLDDDQKQATIRAVVEGDYEFNGSPEVKKFMDYVWNNDKEIKPIEQDIITRLTTSFARGGSFKDGQGEILEQIMKGKYKGEIDFQITLSDGTVITQRELKEMNDEAKKHPIKVETKIEAKEVEKKIDELTKNDENDNRRNILMKIKTNIEDEGQLNNYYALIKNLDGNEKDIETLIKSNIEGLSECKSYQEMIEYLIEHNLITTQCGVKVLGKEDVVGLKEALDDDKLDKDTKIKIVADVQSGDVEQLVKDLNGIEDKETRAKVVADIKEALGKIDTVEAKELHDKIMRIEEHGSDLVISKEEKVDKLATPKSKNVEFGYNGYDEVKSRLDKVNNAPSSKDVVVRFTEWVSSGVKKLLGFAGGSMPGEDGASMFRDISSVPFDAESSMSDNLFRNATMDLPSVEGEFSADAGGSSSRSGIGGLLSSKTHDIDINVGIYGLSSLKDGIELFTTLNNQLARMENNVSLSNAKLKNLFGKERLSVMNTMVSSMKEQQRLLKKQYTYQTQEAKKLQKVLSNTYGFEFDKDGNVTNYLKKLTSMEAKMKSLEKASQKASESSSKSSKKSSKSTSNASKNAYDTYKDSYDDAKKYLDEYMKLQFTDIDKTKVEYENLTAEIRDSIDEIERIKFDDKIYKYVNSIGELTYKFDVLDSVLSDLENQLNGSHGSKRLTIMNQQIEYMAKQESYLKSMLSNQGKEISKYTAKLKEYGFQVDKMGNVTNEASVLNKYQNKAELEKIKDYLDEFKDLNKEMLGTKGNISSLENDLQELNNELSLAKLEQSTYKFANAINESDKAIKKLENDIDTIDTKLNYAFGADKLDLLNQKMELFNKLSNENSDKLKDLTSKNKSYQAELEKFGFKFSDAGEISNYADAMNKLQNSKNYSYIESLLEIWEELRDQIQDTTSSINDYNVQMKDAYKERLELTSDIEDKITDMYKKQLEDRKALLEKEKDEEIKILNSAKEAYNEQRKEEEYNNSIKEQQEIIDKLTNQIEMAKKDDSLGGRSKLNELLEQLEEENKKMQELVKDRQDELMDKMFDDAIEKVENDSETKINQMEEFWSDSKIAEMVKEALGEGVFKDIDGNLTNLQDAMIKFAEDSGEAFGVMGDVIKNDLVSNLQVAYDTIKNINSIYSQLGTQVYGEGYTSKPQESGEGSTLNIDGIEININSQSGDPVEIAEEVRSQLNAYLQSIIDRV